MIEVTFTDVLLLIWAGAATAAWLHTRDELRGAKRFLRAMIEDAEIRDRVVADFKQFKERKEA